MFHSAGISGRGTGANAGTRGWMAPEFFACNAFSAVPHNKTSDVYAFGLVRLKIVQSLRAIG
jgi:hypothetical protein